MRWPWAIHYDPTWCWSRRRRDAADNRRFDGRDVEAEISAAQALIEARGLVADRLELAARDRFVTSSLGVMPRFRMGMKTVLAERSAVCGRRPGRVGEFEIVTRERVFLDELAKVGEA